MVQKVFPYTKMIFATWRSTHVIFPLFKKPLVLVKYNPNRLYGWANLPFSSIFRPFWGLFNLIFLNHSNLIICHGCHFSFSKLFLNVAWYTLSATSAPSDFTPINLFFGFLSYFDFNFFFGLIGGGFIWFNWLEVWFGLIEGGFVCFNWWGVWFGLIGGGSIWFNWRGFGLVQLVGVWIG